IDERGGRPLAVTPMRRSRPASRSARMGRTHAFREGGGLTKPRAARGLQLAAQPLDLAAQPIALTLGPFEIEAQSFILVQHLFDRRAPGGHPVGGITHAPVMPESARRYKSDPVINYGVCKQCRPLESRAKTLFQLLFESCPVWVAMRF